MNAHPELRRRLGTMIAYGFPRGRLETDLGLAAALQAEVLEILPDWRRAPDPGALKAQVADAGFTIHSAHGCWGGQTIRADRVDLGSLDSREHSASLDDLKRCADWLATAGGRYLVIHPGGLSDPEHSGARRQSLIAGLDALAAHVQGTEVVVCVENMPPGVHPGSRMADLAEIVAELSRPEVGLALDTGHAHMTASPAEETLAAGRFLHTTHVHDNNGHSDSHSPPGRGTLDWDAWRLALDEVGYAGPVMLECIRSLRDQPDSIDADLLSLLARLTRRAEQSS